MAETKSKKTISDKDVEEWFKNKFEGWEKNMDKDGSCCKKIGKGKAYKTGAGAGGWVCFFGWVGAVVYYVQVSTSFWDGVLGILKSFIWPAFVVHGLMKFLGL